MVDLTLGNGEGIEIGFAVECVNAFCTLEGAYDGVGEWSGEDFDGDLDEI